ncbi:hypothetical protein, partial [Pseudomonas syringae group sp. J309-1]|uniref:hypothetical protein n=1 Tax=Pseudomonas syringae group sp. J309-1 TaxID=3079588 RepID=UPI00290FC4FF
MRKVHDRRLAGVCAELKRFSLRISAQRVLTKITIRVLLFAIDSLIERCREQDGAPPRLFLQVMVFQSDNPARLIHNTVGVAPVSLTPRCRAANTDPVGVTGV